MAQKLRLVCPNCTAQYEVDESVIPEAGRDVQCSNCGHTWWQLRSDHVDGTTEAPAATADGAGAAAVKQDEPAAEDGREPDPTGSEPEPTTTGAETAAQADAAVGGDEDVTAAEQDDAPDGREVGADAGEADHHGQGDADPAPAPPPDRVQAGGSRGDEDGDADDDPALAAALASAPPVAWPQRRSLDDAVLDVLREEAEREVGARRSEAGAVAATSTSDPMFAGADLGRAEGEREAEVRARMSPPDGFAESGIVDRRGREREGELPDIATINSTWDGKADADADLMVADAAARRRSGFRSGFGVTLLIAAGLALVYVYADQIATRAPVLEASVTSYRESVDRARIWLDGAALNASSTLEDEATRP